MYTRLSWTGSQWVLEAIPACIGRDARIHPGQAASLSQGKIDTSLLPPFDATPPHCQLKLYCLVFSSRGLCNTEFLSIPEL
ncbi:hypothetical protein ANANG_G00200370 [Anguilla anguilla]|uniref:Uncharacterized protein n=1 Tax=Anguilla anguilla TaxID=7936 RepID=A0A9D3M2T8_ANGAN|nr:hypothetical protein ANANG_G00200370 [Anguilla anguilla]